MMDRGQRALIRIVTEGHIYRTPRMNAFDQMWVFKSIEPVFRAMAAGAQANAFDGKTSTNPLLREFASMSDASLDGVISRALRYAEYATDDGDWCRVWDPGPDQILEGIFSVQEIMQSCALIIWQNLRPFLQRDPFEFEQKGKRPPQFDGVALPDGMTWLLTPVRRGMCRYESLLDGTLTLADVGLMNDYLMAEGENESRAYKAAEDNKDQR